MTSKNFYSLIFCLWLMVLYPAADSFAAALNNVGDIMGGTMDRMERQIGPESMTGDLLDGSDKDQDIDTTAPLPKDEDQAFPTFKLKQIKIISNKIIPSDQLKHLWTPIVGKKVSLKDIQKLAHKITHTYRKAGYILSFARVIQQTVKDGAVTLEIVEGYIDQVEVTFEETESKTGHWLSKLTEKIKEHRPITRKVYERYLLLIRDLYPNAKGYLKPSENNSDGAATMQLVIPKRTSHGFNMGVNNFGSDSVGPWMFSIAMDRPAPWNPEHEIELRYNQGQYKSEVWSGGIGYTLPVNANGTTIGMDVDVVRSRPGGVLKDYNVITQENEFSAFIMHPFLRSQNTNIYGSLEFEHTNQTRYIKFANSIKKERSRRAKFSLIGQWHDSFKGANYVKTSAIKGLRGLNSVTTSYPNRTRLKGAADALYFTIDLKRIQHIMGYFSVGFNLVGQYANSTLLDIDRYRSRGFPFNGAYTPAALSGDSGIEGKIELAYTRQDLESMKLLKLFGYLSKMKVWNRNPNVGENFSESAKGMVLGSEVTLNNKVTAALMYGYPFDGPVGHDSMNPQVGVSLNWSF